MPVPPILIVALLPMVKVPPAVIRAAVLSLRSKVLLEPIVISPLILRLKPLVGITTIPPFIVRFVMLNKFTGSVKDPVNMSDPKLVL